jgi:hypothetical protein
LRASARVAFTSAQSFSHSARSAAGNSASASPEWKWHPSGEACVRATVQLLSQAGHGRIEFTGVLAQLDLLGFQVQHIRMNRFGQSKNLKEPFAVVLEGVVQAP